MKQRLLLVLALMLTVSFSFAAKKVAYLYVPNYNTNYATLDNEPVFQGLSSVFDVTAIECSNDVAADYDALVADYDCAVFAEAMSGSKTLSNGLVNLVGRMPIVSMKAFNYTAGRWGWGTPSNPSTKCPSITINPGFENHALFKGLTVENNVIQLYDGTASSNNMVQGISVIADGSPMTAEMVYANTTSDSYYAVHEVVQNNIKYVLVPLSSDAIQTLNTNGVQLVVNAVNYVMGEGGSEPGAKINAAYLYDGSVEYDIENDLLTTQTVLPENNNLTVIDLANYAGEVSMGDSLETFDVLIYSDQIPANSTFASFLFNELNRVPVLNLNAALYAAWGQGNIVAPDPFCSSFTVVDAQLENEVFANTLDGSFLTLYEDQDAVAANKCMGYSLNANSEFADDEVWATAGAVNAIHVHGNRNTYMLLPINSANFMVEGDFIMASTMNDLLDNVVTYLADTKAAVLTASKPSVSYVYDNNTTVATLSSGINGAKIYYTLDGSDATPSSTLYTEPLTITADATVINAMVTAMGYNNSVMLSDTVVVKSKLSVPTHSIAYEGGVAKVTFTAEEGASVYYNFVGSEAVASSSLYDAEAGLTISRPTVVTCMAFAADKLASEVSEFVVDQPSDWTYYNDTLAYLDFADDAIWGSGDLVKAYNYYRTDVKDTIITPNELGTNDTTLVSIPADSLTVIACGSEWELGSYGQRINKQTTGVNASLMVSYGPATAFDAGATGEAMTFMTTKANGEPASAYLRSLTTYKAPFKVDFWFLSQAATAASLTGSYEEALALQISPDANVWTTIDTVMTTQNKLMSRQSIEYTGVDEVYVKIASVNPAAKSAKNKTMIFDILIAAPSEQRLTGIAESTIVGEKSVVATRIYNIAGQQVRQAENGINIIMKVYSDGSVEAKKVMVK